MSRADPPTEQTLREFLLGLLPPDEAERVVAWATGHAEAAALLRDVPAHDALTEVIASTVRTDEPQPPGAEAVVQTVVRALGIDPRPAPAPPPERVGGYRVIRVLGRGGMGVVYEAEDERLGRRVAVKVMKPELVADEPARLRFLREARAVAALKSDHVVTIYQVGEADGAPVLAMEYLDGSTLEGWLQARGGPAEVRDVLWVARDVLTGLAAAHEKGLVHRDVTPANLWVERATDRVKVLDFGLTCGPGGGERITREGAVVGTPAYMSPEQADGRRVDARTDLFSLGVVLYRMLAGRSPFERDSLMAVLSALANETPPPAHTLGVGVPPALSAFIGRLMTKDPAGRPADAGAALAELEKVEAESKAAPAPVRQRPRRWLVAAGLLVAVAASVALVQWVVIRDKDGNERAKLKLEPGDQPALVGPDGKEQPLTPGPGKPAPPEGKEPRPAPGKPPMGRAVEYEIAPGVTMAFCWVPPGKAQLGLPRREKEYLVKEVYGGKTLDFLNNADEDVRGVYEAKSFWLGKYEVTQQEWEAVMDKNPSEFNGKNKNRASGMDTSRFPVEKVSWRDCQDFLTRINKRLDQTGKDRFGGSGKFVLPHEDEWEYACLGPKGNARPFYWGYESNGTQCNCGGTVPYGTDKPGPFLARPTTVGSYEMAFPHPWGLCDMLGNVHEWCENGEEKYSETVRYRFLKGGGWAQTPAISRAAMRYWYPPTDRIYDRGFRVCYRFD